MLAGSLCWAPRAPRNFVRRDGTVIGKVTKQNLKVRLADVKKEINAGESIAGADLEFRNHQAHRLSELLSGGRFLYRTEA